MPYVRRDPDSRIVTGLYANPQPGEATEFLADNDAAVLAYLNPPSEVLAAKLAAGLAVTSTGTPALSATYALDATTLDQIRALASDAKAGLGFPGGAGSFAYPDASGAPRNFDATSIVNLYKAMRDFVFALNTTAATLEAGGPADWPAAAATIP